MNLSGKSIRTVLAKRWIKICAPIVLVTMLFFLLLPFGVRYYLSFWFENNGADTATFQSFSYNPFTSKITLGGIDVTVDGKSILSDANIILDFGLTSLFQRNIHIEQAVYRQLTIDLEQYEDGRWRFASYTIAPNGDKSVVKDEPPAVTSDISTWAFLADRISFEDCKVYLKTPQLDLALVIKQAELTKFSTRANQVGGKFSFKGMINGAEVELNLDTLQVAPDIKIGGKIKVTDYELDSISGLLPANLKTFSGLAGLGGAVDFIYANGSITVDYVGNISLASMDIDSPAFSLQAGKLGWQGRLGYIDQNSDESEKKVIVDGSLVAQQLQTSLPAAGLRLEQQGVQLSSKGELGLINGLEVNAKSSVEIDGFKLFELKNDLPLVAFDTFSIAEILTPETKKISITEAKLSGLVANIPGDMPLKAIVPEIGVTGIKSEDYTAFNIASLSLFEPTVLSSKNGQQLIGIKGLSLLDLAVNDKAGILVQSIILNDLYFLKTKAPATEEQAVFLGKADIDVLGWQKESGLSAAKLALKDLRVNVVKDKDGAISINSLLQAMQQTSSQPVAGGDEEPTEQKAQMMPIRVAKIELVGESGLRFEDHTLAVPFKSDLAISKFVVTDIDSTKPANKASFVLEGEFEDRAPISVVGKIAPFSEKLAMDMKLKLKNYPLTNLSSYTVQSVGTALASGQLKLKTKMSLAADVLAMENSILLKKLETDTIAPELAAKLDNELPIPLDAALSLLRDSKDNISLDIPINGPLSELNVGISDVLVTALGKAIVPAASSYLMYTLGPYGALAYVGMKVGEKLLQVNLPPVNFQPQQITLTVDHKDYLQRIGRILQDRPETDLQLCPVVASWELMSPELLSSTKGNSVEPEQKDLAKLVRLGQQRGLAVQAHLTDNLGVEKSRLLICNTKIVKTKDTVPALLMQL